MIKSMTGFGKGEAVVGDKKFRVELRSLNSKQLDLSIKLPSKYRAAEAEVRSFVIFLFDFLSLRFDFGVQR